MLKIIMIALRATIVTLVFTGLVYPLAVTGLAQALFPGRANGSLVNNARGQAVGSELIGQNFSNPAYFHPRPSAAGDAGYDAMASGGSNWGATSQKLRDRITTAITQLQMENPDAPTPPPADLVMASASGLDPHITPEAALWQAPRVAKARQVAPERVRQIIGDYIEGRTLGVWGEPRVNVLLLNQALDRQFGAPR
ncbi:MAG: potassium-transporting ATPase subunit KdpC [Candidatus Sumerlaeota bacterium]|nr:potassium-transporting ATPase subunit KdpC [Candidatus Sumerlaeota bacterium]